MATKNKQGKPAPKGAPHVPLNAVDAEWQQDDYRLFGFTVGQVAIPNLVIVQNTSSMPGKKEHIGQIYNTITRQFFKQVELVFVGWNTPRAVFPFPFNKDAKQLCASQDGLAPFDRFIGQEIRAKSAYDELTLTIPETCAECPLYESPLCAQMFRYFGLQLIPGSDPMPFAMRLKRSAMNEARKLNFLLNLMEQRRQYFSFYMTTQEEIGDGGEYYTPIFEEANDASPLFNDAKRMNMALTDRIRQAGQAQLQAVNDSD